jgi:hypothetical protein
MWCISGITFIYMSLYSQSTSGIDDLELYSQSTSGIGDLELYSLFTSGIGNHDQ